MKLELTEKNLEELYWRLTSKDDPCTPLEAVGAWLWSHAGGSEKHRDVILDKLKLKRVPTPNGGNSIKEIAAVPS